MDDLVEGVVSQQTGILAIQGQARADQELLGPVEVGIVVLGGLQMAPRGVYLDVAAPHSIRKVAHLSA